MAVRSLAFIFSALLVAAAPSSTRRDSLVVHEKTNIYPTATYTLVGKANETYPLTLRLALAHQDEPGLLDALTRVSDPTSATYGQYLSKAEVDAFLGPSPDTVAAVGAWLAEYDIVAHPVSSAGNWIEFTTTVQQANALLGASFLVFNHTDDGETTQAVRTMSYSLPAELQNSIVTIDPGISFPTFSRAPTLLLNQGAATKKRRDPASCDTISPACIQALYGISTDAATQLTNQLAVSGFKNQSANHSDLVQFLLSFRSDAPIATFGVDSVDDGLNVDVPGGRGAGVEADLDTQYTVGVATGVPTTFISVGHIANRTGELTGFIDLANHLLAQSNPPQVVSTSYGFNEMYLSVPLSRQLCTLYAALGARGTSVIFAAGDGGIGGVKKSTESTTLCSTFEPTFPMNCPYVTTVGATAGIPEAAANFTSGGFSWRFPRPAYQDAAVAPYVAALGDTYKYLYNTTGRGFPDVVTLGVDIEVVNAAQTGTVSGTAASAPIFASIIALLNDRLVAAGKPVLGFLNPFLYANPQAFTDITVGSNPGCKKTGFPAATGWDPITGLGSPIFSELAKAAGV